jgi:PfaD family protein
VGGSYNAISATSPLGHWLGDDERLSRGQTAFQAQLESVDRPLVLVRDGDDLAVVTGGQTRLAFDGAAPPSGARPVVGFAAPMALDQLGDAGFRHDHRLRYAYMTGAMANGIASAPLVAAAAKAGMLGSYGAAGQSIDMINEALDHIEANLHGEPFAVNLIHSPNEPAHEAAVVDLLIQRNVRLVEASAYLRLTLDAVRYRVHGIHRGEDGRVVAPNRIIAKASRVEVARQWFAPPPPKMLDELVAAGHITTDQARLAAHVPMAQDLTAEADSGGHTDNRPALALLPTMIALAARLTEEHGYEKPLRVGAAGGIATPASAAAALAMGAAYLVTGTVNQACVESGSSDPVRQMLAEAQQADCAMAPAADMFEMGVKLQVLKRGTMFAIRANKLYDTYRAYDSIDTIPPDERAKLEKTIFRAPLETIWRGTQEYFGQYDPAQIAKAQTDPKHKMALIFRWYLGLSSRWANAGQDDRRMDYQVWCGPAMGAFNEWAAGTFLAEPTNRGVVVVGLNLLWGAAVALRAASLRWQGAAIDFNAGAIRPRTLEQLQAYTHTAEGAPA